MIERHIEKIVLAVCALLLLCAVVYWVPSPGPRKIMVITNAHGAKESLPPGEVDEMLKEAARAIEQSIQQAKADVYVPPDYLADVSKLREQPFGAMGQWIDVGLAQRPPTFDPFDKGDGKKVSLAELESTVPAPGKPLVQVERELPLRDGVLEDILASHVAAIYPWGELEKSWDQVLMDTPLLPNLIVGKVEAEIRQRRADGTWTSPVSVEFSIPDIPANAGGLSLPEIPDYDGKNGADIRAAIRRLDELQEVILEPEYWDILWADGQYGSWRVHLANNPVSENAAPEETSPIRASVVPGGGPGMMGDPFGGMPGPAMGGDPFGSPGPVAPTRTTQRTTPARTPRTRTPAGGGMGGGDPFGGGGMGGGTPARTRTTRATPTPRRSRAETVSPAVPVTKEIAPPSATPVPSLQQQMDDGEVLIWFHDTSIRPMREYQYRIRLGLVSPLLTFTSDVLEPEDANQALIYTPYSKWSDPISVPKETEFFVTGHSEQMGNIRAQIFTRSLGQWISERFQVSEGDAIGSVKKTKVTNPEDGTRVSKDVDFSCEAVVVDLDFTKTVRKGAFDKPTVEMIYLNDKGELRSRIRTVDEESARYDQLKQDAERARISDGTN